MTVIDEANHAGRGLNPPPAVHMRILDQMAESLDDQIAALYRRAAAFEEEEFLLTREVDERQAEISRLMLKLESMRAERDRLMERIESMAAEAIAIKGEVLRSEEEIVLAVIESLTTPSIGPPVIGAEPLRGARFFRRLTISVQKGDEGRRAPEPLTE